MSRELEPPSSAQGFSLLELLAVLSIAAILTAIALPSFQQLGLSASRGSGGTMLLAALNQARSEAIARNGSVVVCRRNAFASGSFPVCDMSTSGSWAQGWIVYRDSDNSIDATEPDAAADIIAVFDSVGRVTAGATADAFNVVPRSNPAYLSFSGNGRASQALSFTFCDNSHRLTDSRRVDISLSGFVSLRSLDAATTSSACS